jgi:magnesium transporter
VERAGTGFVWIGLHEPSEAQIAGIAERSACTRLRSRMPCTPTSGPSSGGTSTCLFALVETAHYDDQLPGGTAEVVETGEVMIFLGSNS